MTNIDDAFRVESLSINDEVLLCTKDFNPSVAGYESPIGSLLLNKISGELFIKSGIQDTDWSLYDKHSTNVSNITSDPVGFENDTDSTISFNDTTRTFTITPLDTKYNIWLKGVPYTITNTHSVQISNTAGVHYIYFTIINNVPVLQTSPTINLTNLLKEHIVVSIIVWDNVDNKHLLLCNERHTISLQSTTHIYLHQIFGAQYVNGFDVINIDLNNTGSSDTEFEIGLSDGIIADEDLLSNIKHNTTPALPFEQILRPTGQIPVFYKFGSTGAYRSLDAQIYPIAYSGNRIQYNSFDNGIWGLTEAFRNKDFIAVWICATNSIEYPIIAILGQHISDNLATAKDDNEWNTLDTSFLPIVEFKVLYRLIFEANINYENAIKASIVDVLDLRDIFTAINVSGNNSTTDHLVIVSNTDTTPSTLNEKILPGSNVTTSININSGNERLVINAADPTIKISNSDTTSNYLISKLSAGTNISLVHNNTGGNETITINNTLTDHDVLAGKDADNQHPIDAIIDLQSTLDSKQSTLVSGSNIKTINNESILSSGNLNLQSALVSGSNIKSIAGYSLLGAGDQSLQLNDLSDVMITNPSVGQALIYNGTHWVNIGNASGGGGFAKRIWSGNVSTLTGTSIITPSVTPPDITAGTQVWSVTILPYSTDVSYVIQTSLPAAASINNANLTLALFRNDEYIGGTLQISNSGNNSSTLSLSITDTPNSTTPVVYQVRIGTNTGTWYINRRSHELTYGGFKSGWVVWEY